MGAWSGRLQRRPSAEAIDVINELADLGYRSAWIPESPFGKDVLTFAAVLLGGSHRMTVATGIAITWVRDPAAMMNAGRTLGDAFPGRFVLGIGISHESTARARGHDYQRPVTTMRKYLADMGDAAFDGHEPVWTPPVLVAALGPRMLEVAAEAADGAHPFLTTPDHTRLARTSLGDDRLLAVEQAIVIGPTGPARAKARDNLARFLAWPNYRHHLLRLGFDEHDFLDGCSDRLIDALYAIGDEEAVRLRVAEHLDAGADHVCLQVVATDADEELAAFRRLAPALPLT